MNILHNRDQDHYLRLWQILQIIPVSRSTWYRGIQAGIYPAPIKLSYRASAWRKSDIQQLMDEFSREDITRSIDR